MQLWREDQLSPKPLQRNARSPRPSNEGVAWDVAINLINRADPFGKLPPPSVAGLLRTLPEGWHACLESFDAATVLQGTPWIAFTSNLGAYPAQLRNAKQPNGHARIRAATIAEVKRSTLGKRIGVLFVGSDADPEILRQFARVAVVVIEVRDVTNPPDALLAAVPLSGVEKTLLYKGEDDVTQPSAHVVFYAGDGPPPAWPTKAFRELVERCDVRLRGAIDVCAYLSAKGVVTREDAQSTLSKMIE